MKIKNETQHDQVMTTNQMLSHMQAVANSLKQIKKIHKVIKGWKKALAEGKVNQSQYDATIQKAERILANSFETASEYGMGLGQYNDLCWEKRSALHANDMIQDATK